ncbi:MAG TPA: hypothetical protein VFN49_07660 [Candidatus Aquilonibacter sp.]|nr:hypothetical protein [Candidatus Aquilonibacter sp.]
MRKFISRWTLLGALAIATLVGIEHRLTALPPTPPHPPTMVSAETFSLQ